MGEIKGIMVNGWVSFLKTRYGEEQYRQGLASLPEAEKLKLDRPLLDASWYPIELTKSLAKVQAVISKNANVHEEMGRYLAEHAFGGAYRLFLAPDPIVLGQKIVQASSFFYRNVHKLEVEVTGPSACTVRYHLAQGRPSVTTCTTRCGWWARALEMSGATQVKVTHPKCRARGDEVCEFLMSWLKQPVSR